jgi:hypothetical protein
VFAAGPKKARRKLGTLFDQIEHGHPVCLACWNRFTRKKLARGRLFRLDTSKFRSGI